MSFSDGNQLLWLVYIIISNLDRKTRQSQTRLGNLLIGSIPIIYKFAKNSKNKDKDLKAKVYHLVLKPLLEYMISVF